MSAINVHPPQTYSRLFRPWDNNRSNSSNTSQRNKIFKRECSSVIPTSIPMAIKRENHGNSNSDSDREESCALSSCSKSSYDDSSFSNSKTNGTTIMEHIPPSLLNKSEKRLPVLSARSQQSSKITSNDIITTTSPILSLPSNHQYVNGCPLEQQQEQHRIHMANAVAAAAAAGSPSIPITSDIYYAAAAHAAVTGNGIASTMTAAATAAFGMDAYTLNLMEQEYARVMAEDAHLKAINARKQRPKKFKCPHCDVAFSNNGQLKGHIRIHTGERPFKCDVDTCGKTFTRNEELTRHKRIHTGLRPYPCTACGKKFGRRDHLKKHMKTHMPQERQLGPAIFVPMYPYLYGY